MSKPVKLFLGGLVFLLISGAAFFGYLYSEFIKKPASLAEVTVIYEVTPGKSFTEIARDLESKNIIKNAKFFNIFAKITGYRSKIKMGEYEFKSTMLPMQVLEILSSGKSIFKKFTIAEGLSIYEIAELYEKEGFGSASSFMELVRDPHLIEFLLGAEEVKKDQIDSLEGYLFPETYQITKFTSTRDLIIQMVQLSLKNYNALVAQKKLEGWTRHQLMTLASIVEKETGAGFERTKVSSVFHNRLLKKMKLQTDPTIIYGKAEKTGKIEINITKEDLIRPTRYNTYVIPGLPPGPISNPGKEAILATLTPEDTKFLYFVSQNNGTHIFSENYVDHEKAVKKFQLDAKAREGKSWKDLNKKEADLKSDLKSAPNP